MFRTGITLSATLLTALLQPAAVLTVASDFSYHRTETIAHRGASGYAPENTMAAFRKAVEMKADYIELDVHVSKDGHLVVIHDNTVDRTTNGTGRVGALTLKEMLRLDAGRFFHSAFAGEPIPTLDQVLDEFRGKIGILIELKSPELYPGVESKVADALQKRGMDKARSAKVIVQSFHFESLKRFHKLLPDIPIGVLTNKASHLTDAMLDEFATYANYVNPSRNLVTADLTDRIHERGMQVFAWTVRKRAEVNPLLIAGVDGIITDFPDYVPSSHRR
ncbi:MULTISPECIES: glycerophosphodiester phosphodiesterase family protein [Bacillales]|uniref:Glycerophosphodiester phosphodiesterase n=1 Tax=Brevibacillus aydinogluensis TaxID=927786 RepID=A0AA48RIV8_9BACL|nr:MULTISPECIES: glycerophosphodiester phosphodiesterase family protein [Bacillales]REK66898.1 MAG: glycerophosphodiester phosphodiesterase [Brevibacillus sp.]MBR8658880.1 glycerophosphodiester phosphodiesterase [Brevibacillus sp. NL20B1]MDT3416368.1 glycerophosphoryl diester phosphodiesterase [Brevibacillus aydinogluensis]NNV02386.1 glycerophosphodiester phosphodiesterase [Brevibacillus sp. MCWH]UFJ62689.1 glycerophosphodiester phosphodiesterase [Anoxybacillus sediminis]